MKYAGNNTLGWLADQIKKLVSDVSQAVFNTFEEVYANTEEITERVETLEKNICECTYDPNEEMLIVPQFWDYDEFTETLTLHGELVITEDTEEKEGEENG